MNKVNWCAFCVGYWFFMWRTNIYFAWKYTYLSYMFILLCNTKCITAFWDALRTADAYIHITFLLKWYILYQWECIWNILCRISESWFMPHCGWLYHYSDNEGDDVSNHQPHDCLLNRFFKRRLKKTSKLGVAGLCEGNSTVTSEFPAQRTSNTENVSIWWRHHVPDLNNHTP